MTTEPFIKANPGDRILADQWNTMQVKLIEEIGRQISEHTHEGAAAGKKLLGAGIDATAKLSIAELTTSAKLVVKGVDVFDKLATLGTTDTTLQASVGTLQSNVTTLQSQVGTLQTRATTLEGNVTTLQTKVTQLGTDKLDVTGGTINGSLSVTTSLTVAGHNVMTEVGALQTQTATQQTAITNLQTQVANKLNVTGGTINGSLSVTSSLTVNGRDVLTELNNLGSNKLSLSGGTISGPLTVTGRVMTNSEYAFGSFAWSGNSSMAYLRSPTGGNNISISGDGRMHLGDIVGDNDVSLEIAGKVRLRSSDLSPQDAGLLFSHHSFSGTSSGSSSSATVTKADLARMGMSNGTTLAISSHVNEMGDISTTGRDVLGIRLDTGDMYLEGMLSQGTSDARLKKNVEHLEGALDKLLQLRGVTFEWQEPTKHRGQTGAQIGLIAQEVEVFFPQWVGENPEGYKTLKIGSFEALVIEAVRELQNQLRAERGQPAMPRPQPPSAKEMHAADAARARGRKKPTVKGREVVATYDYKDEHGKLLYQVQRYQPKAFRMRRPDGKGDWIRDTEGVRPVLFHLPEVLAAENVLIVEGEKDAQTAIALGLPNATWAVTTSPGPVEWRSSYSMSLRGKRVVICPDADRAGMRYMHHIVRDLQGIAAEVRWIQLPSGPKDITEWVEAGGKKEDLAVLIENAKPVHPDELPPLPAVRRRNQEKQP